MKPPHGLPPLPGFGDSTSPPPPGPDADALLALMQRLDATDPDCALELSRLLAAAEQAGERALALADRGRAPVALAWLRRITREADTVLALWHRVQGPEPQPPLERRAHDRPREG